MPAKGTTAREPPVPADALQTQQSDQYPHAGTESRAIVSMSDVKRVAYLAAAAALLVLVIFVNPPSHTAFVHVLHKSAHSVVFALIALIYLKLAPTTSGGADWWKPYVVAIGVVLVCGSGTEIAQSFLNRDPSLEDVLRDLNGGTASLAAALFVQRRIRMHPRLRACVVLLATAASFTALAPLLWCVSAYANRDLAFPIIWAYRSPLDMYFVRVWTGDVSGVDLPTEWAVRPNEKAIEVDLDHETPSIALYESYPDWRGYGTLSLDITNPNPRPLNLIVRVNSESHDWFDYRFTLKPRARSTTRIRLDEIRTEQTGGELDLRNVRGTGIGALETMAGGRFYVNRISLESAATHALQ
jgi:VanZ family protein